MTRRTDEGQAAVELALVLPLVFVLLLVVVQVALIGRDEILVVTAAREAARAAALDRRPGVPRAAAIAAVPGLKAGRLTTETSYQGGSPVIVTAVVTYRAPTDVALVGPLFPSVTLQAKAAMRSEMDTERGTASTGREK